MDVPEPLFPSCAPAECGEWQLWAWEAGGNEGKDSFVLGSAGAETLGLAPIWELQHQQQQFGSRDLGTHLGVLILVGISQTGGAVSGGPSAGAGPSIGPSLSPELGFARICLLLPDSKLVWVGKDIKDH